MAADDEHTFWVSTAGNDSNPCSRTDPCLTISHAVGVAGAGDTVKVEHGTYTEGVVIDKMLDLVGDDHPTIDATTSATGVGILVKGPAASGSAVEGFTVKNAYFEGILVQGSPGAPGQPVRHVSIEDNHVTANNTGFAAQSKGECRSPAPNIPGDCGEGLHLFTVADSTVSGNRVDHNSGGILVTDEFGPNHDNLIAGNRVTDNADDCGITIAGHNSHAVANGTRQPALGGVYDNTIRDNVSNHNGLLGFGAGILLAAAGPGGGVYDNKVIDNQANGNGLAGVTIHSHFGGQDVNGNVIKDNDFRHDNLTNGETFDFNPAPSQTADITILSGLAPGVVGPPAPGPITGTVIEGNDLSDAHFGIWTLNAVTDGDVQSDNEFSDVSVRVSLH